MKHFHCENGCEDKELFLHSRCHPDAPTWTVLLQDEGLAEVRCYVCSKVVCTLALTDDIFKK